MEHKYILEPYKGMKTRYTCPNCQNRQKSFSKYINIETGEYLADDVGRCNREDKCSYHLTPKEFFDKNGQNSVGNSFNYRNPVDRIKKASYIPKEAFNRSLGATEGNSFYMALKCLYGNYTASHVFDLYRVGSCNRFAGGVIFWQIDIQGLIRTGKMMAYNPETAKRVKGQSGKSLIDWAHRFIDDTQFNLSQCFFGEHLLNEYPNKPVAIVESEKTAIIASVHLPQFIWLACGAKTGLNEKCEVLKGRKVILYPDLGGYEVWSIKAGKYGFMISDILERSATDEQRANGLDLADFLIKDYVQDGKINPNRHFLIENRIINLLDKAERQPEDSKAFIKQAQECSRPDLLEQYAPVYAPSLFKNIQ